MIKLKFLIVITTIVSVFNANAQNNYVQFVNPFIGTGGHGHTYPGATLPHGMVQLSPDTRLDGWDGCGGYHYSDSFIYGFSHTHLSGTGVSDYGDILLMPMAGKPSPDNKIYGSAFSHKNEKASAGYYSVKLDDDNIHAELTTTERTGFHHYSFPSPDNNIIIDLNHRDEVIESSLNIEDSVTITGLRRSKAWATDQYVYFVMKFSAPIIKKGIWENNILKDDASASLSNNIKAYLQFALKSTNELYVKVALSSVSIEGARKNMNRELAGWDFESTKRSAERKWNAELSKIEVQSTDTNKLNIFYTALYHTAIVPNINMDVDSMYRGRDGKIHKAGDFTNYTVFSLWDTYRAAHPLYTIIDRKRTLDYIKTFLAQYEQGGRLPVWELAGNETDCMIGYHSVSVIADAFIKGIRDFDTALALQAMKKSAEWDHFGLDAYRKKGMIEADDEHESVSKALEYAYDDFCIAQFAGLIGNKAEQNKYALRAQYYKNMLDPETGFMRPRKNGDWIQPFDPREVNGHFTEANSWQYSFYFPHDITEYTKLRGGTKVLEAHLDSLFSAPTQTTGREQSDITGMIGQYAHGNEPSHHVAFLYHYAGVPHKTQKIVHKVMSEFYKNTPDGLIGNEDCGQMSAWYVLNAMGFYSVTPATTNYIIGTPSFPYVKINLENGNVFEIRAHELSDTKFYIRDASLHANGFAGNQFEKVSFLQHSNIMSGGRMNFKMSDKPSSFFAKNYPKGGVRNQVSYIVTNPVIRGGNKAFKESKRIQIQGEKEAKIFYTLDGREPDENSNLYIRPIIVDSTLTIKAIAIKGNKKSFVTTASYKKILHNWHIQTNTPYLKQYTAGGSEGLADGLYGDVDWRKGNWQGYQNNDVHVVIDLKNKQSISEISVGFLQDVRSWIIMPSHILIEVSANNKFFYKVFEGNNLLDIKAEDAQVKRIKSEFKKQPARYIRITASQYGKLPEWHAGAGSDSIIFIDEITVK